MIKGLAALFITLLGLVVTTGEAWATPPYELTYSGRFVDSHGAPVSGPVALNIEFFTAITGGAQLGSSFNYSSVLLSDGLFQITISLVSSDFNTIFNGSSATWLQVTDTTHNRVYPRQRMFAVPYALKVPIDSNLLDYDSSGRLTIKESTASGVGIIAALNNSTEKISSAILPALVGDVTGSPGSNTVTKIQNVPVNLTAGNVGSGGYLQYNGTSFVLSSIASAAGGTVTNVGVSAPLIATGNTGIAPTLSLPAASASVDGYLSSADWNSFQNKQSVLFPASSTQNGYLSSSDWSVFNSMQPVLGYSPVRKVGDTMSGHLLFTGQKEVRFGDIAQNYVGFKAPSSISASVSFTLPTGDGASGQLLATDGSGTLSFVTPNGGTVKGIAAGTGLSGGTITTSGTLSLADTGVTPGSFVRANIVVDGQGRLSAAAASGAIIGTDIASNTIDPSNIKVTPCVNGVLKIVSGAWGCAFVDAGELTGTLSVAQGGTGLATLASNGILFGNGAGNVGVTAAGSQYQVLQAGPGGVPGYGAVNLGQAAAITGTLPVASGGTGGTDKASARTSLGLGNLATMNSLSTSDVAESGNLYYTDARARAAISSAGVLSYDNGSGVISLVRADGSNHGYLAATDWTAFNAKQSALGYNPVNKLGDTMSGALNMGGYDLNAAGNVGISAAKTLGLGIHAADPSLQAGDSGKIWYNSTTSQIKYWNGTNAIPLGIAGSGLASLNGEIGTSQSFGNVGVAGSAPYWSSANTVHTLNIPLASASGVTAGLISKSEYDNFNGKQNALNPASNSQNGYLVASDWITFNGKGGVASIASGAGLTGGPITTAGTFALETSGVVAGSYVRANVIVDGYGRITAATASASIVNVDVAPGAAISEDKLAGLFYTDMRARLASSVAGPLTYNNATGAFGIMQVGGGANGYLTSTDWISFNSKVSGVSIATGSGLTGGPITGSGTIALDMSGVAAGSYVRANVIVDNYGRITSAAGSAPIVNADVATGAAISEDKLAGLFYTDTRAHLASSVAGPLTYNNATGAFGIMQVGSSLDGYLSSADWSAFNSKQTALSAASSSQDGYIASSDWSTFNGKQANLGYAPLNKAGDTMNGPLLMGSQNDLRFGPVGGTAYVSLKAPATVSSIVTWTLPQADGTSGQNLATNGSGLLSWMSGALGTVTGVSAGTGLTGGTISSSGTLALETSGVTSGTYTRANVSVDSYGRILSAASTAPSDLNSTDVTGTLSVAKGGTGGTIYSANSVILGGTTFSSVSGSQYQVLQANSAGSAPFFGALNLGQAAAITGTLGITNGGTGGTDQASARSELGLGGLATMNSITTSDVAEGSNLYYLDARARFALSASAPLVYSNGTGAFSLAKANGSNDGYLSLGDWTAFNAGSSQWSASNGNIYRSSGNVGIGTIAPAFALEVQGALADSIYNGLRLTNSSYTATGRPTLDFYNNHASASFSSSRIYSEIGASGTGSKLYFNVANSSKTLTNRMVIDVSGNVGISMTSPGSKLQVNGNAVIGYSANTAGPANGLAVSGNVGIGTTAPVNLFDVNGSAAIGSYAGTNTAPTGGLIVSGNVGIGTTAPIAKLAVAGQIVATLPSALAPTGVSQAIDFSTGNIQTLDLTGAQSDTTLTFTNTVAGGSYAIKIIQGATARTVTWPAGVVKWPGGTPITLSTSSGAVDLVTLFFDGLNYYAVGGNNFQ